jgi:hypothetical protein
MDNIENKKTPISDSGKFRLIEQVTKKGRLAIIIIRNND